MFEDIFLNFVYIRASSTSWRMLFPSQKFWNSWSSCWQLLAGILVDLGWFGREPSAPRWIGVNANERELTGWEWTGNWKRVAGQVHWTRVCGRFRGSGWASGRECAAGGWEAGGATVGCATHSDLAVYHLLFLWCSLYFTLYWVYGKLGNHMISQHLHSLFHRIDS